VCSIPTGNLNTMKGRVMEWMDTDSTSDSETSAQRYLIQQLGLTFENIERSLMAPG
jgi:hypothetical protein